MTVARKVHVSNKTQDKVRVLVSVHRRRLDSEAQSTPVFRPRIYVLLFCGLLGGAQVHFLSGERWTSSVPHDDGQRGSPASTRHTNARLRPPPLGAGDDTPPDACAAARPRSAALHKRIDDQHRPIRPLYRNRSLSYLPSHFGVPARRRHRSLVPRPHLQPPAHACRVCRAAAFSPTPRPRTSPRRRVPCASCRAPPPPPRLRLTSRRGVPCASSRVPSVVKNSIFSDTCQHSVE